MLLHYLQNWQPFRIDALGIVTLLGAEQVNRAIGRLVSNPITDYIPLLAAFVVAGDSFSDPIPGFQLYNVSDGIVAGDIAPWFSRWILTQNVSWNSTYLSLGFMGKDRGRRPWTTLVSLVFGVMVLGTLFVVALLMSDWWGLANTASMAVSVIVRRYVLHERAKGLRRGWCAESDERWATTPVKVLLITPAGQAITIFTLRGVVTEVLLTESKVQHKSIYAAVRMLGWIGFGGHVVSLGMASLVNQLLTIVVLLSSTWITTFGIGTDSSVVAGNLKIERFEEDLGQESRARVYHRLEMSKEEEELMIRWCLMPSRSKADWWTRYQSRATSDRTQFDLWKRRTEHLRTVNNKKKGNHV